MKSNAELVQAAKLGDHTAFGELLRRYERVVWTTAWQVVRDYHASQDITQETFILAHRQLGELRNADAVGPWLLRIAGRLAVRFAKVRRSLDSLSDVDVPAPSAEVELSCEQAELIDAIGRLPEHERLVTVLHYVDGHPVAEVAKLTGRPVGTVTKQLSRAVRRLRLQLQNLING